MSDIDFIANGKATGTVAQKLLANGMNPMALKPWIAEDGRCYTTVMVNGVAKAALTNNATLRKDEWKHMDEAILPASRSRLVGIADLYSKNLVYRLGNGLGKTVLEYESLSEITPAEMTMDGVNRSQKDRPNYELNYLPLPIIHKDFHFNARVLAASRTTGDPWTPQWVNRPAVRYLRNWSPFCSMARVLTLSVAERFMVTRITPNVIR